MLPGARSLHISEKAFLLWTSFGQSCFPLIPAYMAGSTDHGTYLPTLQYKHENQKANSLRMTCTLSLHTLKCLSKDAVNTKPTSLTMDSSLSLQLSARLWGLACVGDIGLMFRKLLLHGDCASQTAATLAFSARCCFNYWRLNISLFCGIMHALHAVHVKAPMAV